MGSFAGRSAEPDRLHRDWGGLAEYRDSSAPGWTREAFSDSDTEGRQFVAGLMREAGLDVKIDAVGNVIGHLDGSDPNAKLLLTGSHTDTVYGGGRFDGVVGVLGAIEAVRLLRESSTTLRHSLRIVDFSNEEPNAHGLSCVGSRAIAGNLDKNMLALRDDEGSPLAARMRRAGWRPEEAGACGWAAGDVEAYVELHIEQGPVLERSGVSVGVVTSIAGIARFMIEIQGRRDHAGTMPMSERRDACCSAAAAILAVERIAAAGADSVGTTGKVVSVPEAVNVVAEFASVSGEFRSPTRQWLDDVPSRLEAELSAESQKRRTQVRIDWRPAEEPVAMTEAISDVLASAASMVGHDSMRLYSGAGHDTVQMARLCPTGMLFIPSIDGRSHCPEEASNFDDIVRGVDTLLQSLVALDER